MGSPLKDLQSSTCSVTTQIQRLTTYARANCPCGTAEVHFTLVQSVACQGLRTAISGGPINIKVDNSGFIDFSKNPVEAMGPC